MNNQLLKVCGLTQQNQLEQLSNWNVDFVGLIFAEKSKRYVLNKIHNIDFSKIKSKKVGVFVDEYPNKIIELVDKYKLDFVQLHGNESQEDCTKLKEQNIKIIKAIAVENNVVGNFSAYENIVDYFLFDTKTTAFGGTGQSFDYTIIENLRIEKPFFISGGIDIKRAIEIINNLKHPNFVGLDINSKFEIEPGVKDLDKIELLIKELKNGT